MASTRATPTPETPRCGATQSRWTGTRTRTAATATRLVANRMTTRLCANQLEAGPRAVEARTVLARTSTAQLAKTRGAISLRCPAASARGCGRASPALRFHTDDDVQWIWFPQQQGDSHALSIYDRLRAHDISPILPNPTSSHTSSKSHFPFCKPTAFCSSQKPSSRNEKNIKTLLGDRLYYEFHNN